MTKPTDQPIAIESQADRIAPLEVKPIEYKGVRYAQEMKGFTRGLDQYGGYITATDIATGKELWMLIVYENKRKDPELEGDVQDVFFESMTREGDTLHIANEQGKSFIVDLNTRTVTAKP